MDITKEILNKILNDECMSFRAAEYESLCNKIVEAIETAPANSEGKQPDRLSWYSKGKKPAQQFASIIEARYRNKINGLYNETKYEDGYETVARYIKKLIFVYGIFAMIFKKYRGTIYPATYYSVYFKQQRNCEIELDNLNHDEWEDTPEVKLIFEKDRNTNWQSAYNFAFDVYCADVHPENNDFNNIEINYHIYASRSYYSDTGICGTININKLNIDFFKDLIAVADKR